MMQRMSNVTNVIKIDLVEVKDLRDKDEAKDADIVRNLLVLGDKYEVTDLVEKAENWLAKNLEVDNVLQTVEVANLVRSERLFKKCIEFIVRNRGEEKLSFEVMKEFGLSDEVFTEIVRCIW